MSAPHSNFRSARNGSDEQRATKIVGLTMLVLAVVAVGAALLGVARWLEFDAIPTPATMVILLAGFVLFTAARRRS